MGRSSRRSTNTVDRSPSSRPLFPSISLKGSPTTQHTTSEPPQSARSSLINVLTRPRHTTALSQATASTIDDQLAPEEDFSDQSTISSYASSIVSSPSRQASSEEIAKVYRHYLEQPFVTTKSTIKHSEFGHCNNPNWRWTSQVSTT
jgi:serine palmitoyltransferase